MVGGEDDGGIVGKITSLLYVLYVPKKQCTAESKASI